MSGLGNGDIMDFDFTNSAKSPSLEDTGLTFDKLMETIELIKKPTLYYVATAFCEKGMVARVPESFNSVMFPSPCYMICHPDDFLQLERTLSIEFTLIPLSDDFKPTQDQLAIWLDEIARKAREKMTEESETYLWGYKNE